ncbi:peptidoglycan recognition protein [Pieris rapae]|uniref:peptidoglycan recognition protein n=1 Tax=Pieris rapae TaxID=64459 RepID=UPI001E27B6C3|nr:peptidoglycan recognition protein [Pieris rapae]
MGQCFIDFECEDTAMIFFTAIFVGLTLADASCPSIVSKKEWGGLKPIHVSYLLRPVDLVIIQHTVTPFCSTDGTCTEAARSIQNYQVDELGYWDIGMSFLVGGNGKIYEGCGWLHVGAHTYGYNSKSIGISFIGNYNNDDPTSAQLEAVKDLLRCGVEEGHLSSDYKVVGHKQLIATQSPGRRLYQVIRTWPEWLEDVTSIKNKS